MVIFPGGGYAFVCSDREGEPIALNYLAKGVNAFVVKYSVGENAVFPRQLLDAARAFVYVKEHGEEFHINPERIFVCGFSAGGHLAGSLTTIHSYAEEILSLDKDYCKPKGAVLSYPVVSAYTPTHTLSFENLYKKSYDTLTKEEKDFVSLEKNINLDTPPMFIWHTSLDTTVPPAGSLNLARAFTSLGRAVAFYLYPYGKHGAAMANELTSIGACGRFEPIPEAEEWFLNSVNWMKTV
jgi:acetyl esterase/lipase